jgi:TraB/PrgY/gumN family
MKSFLLCSPLLVVGLTILFLLSCISWGIEAGFAHGFHHSLQCTVSHLRCRRKAFLHRFAMSPMVDDDDDIQHLPSLSSVRPMQGDPSNRRTWMAQTAQQLVSATLGITSASHHSFVAMAATATTELVPSGAAVLCDSTVSVWQKPSSGRTIYLLGTAHISDVSAQLAGALVRRVHPDAVFVELDVKRVLNLPALHDTATASAQNAAPAVLVPALPSTATTSTSSLPLEGTSTQAPIASIPSTAASTSSDDGNWFQRKVLNFAGAAVGKAVQGMYSNLSNSGFSPGEEFAAAIRAGREIGATIVLGDQDVQVTLRRLAQALSVTDLQPLLNPNAEFEKTMTDLLPLPPALESSNTAAGDPAQFKRDLSEYVERMKSRETVRTIVHELDTVAPAVVRVMLTERDAYMASGLDSLESFKKVVGVMGLAHIDGVEQNLRGRGWTPMHLSCPPK